MYPKTIHEYIYTSVDGISKYVNFHGTRIFTGVHAKCHPSPIMVTFHCYSNRGMMKQ